MNVGGAVNKHSVYGTLSEKEATTVVSQQRQGRVKTQGAGSWHLDFECSASRTVTNKFVLFKPPKLWYFVMAA